VGNKKLSRDYQRGNISQADELGYPSIRAPSTLREGGKFVCNSKSHGALVWLRAGFKKGKGSGEVLYIVRKEVLYFSPGSMCKEVVRCWEGGFLKE